MRAPQQSIDCDQFLAKAFTFHQSGNLAAAQLLYAQILSDSPKHFDALHLLGVLRHQQGRNQEAQELITAAYRVNPNSVEALSNLGIVLQELGRNEEAVAAYDRALAINPRHAEALNNRGTAQRALDRPAGAAMSFDRAIAIRPDYADAHYNRAGLMSDLGRHEEAAAGYAHAIALRPDHRESHRGLARAQHALRNFEAALASYNRVIALQPDDVDARFQRGAALSALNRHQEALDEYDKVLEKVPDHVTALNNRGAALQELGRPDEAEASFGRAIALRPDNSKVHGNRGAALFKAGRFEKALESLDRALALQPNDANALNNRGNALLALQRHREALESYDRALTITPDYIQALNNRGVALNEIKLFQEAVASLDKAIALAPDHAEAYYNRGNALKGLKLVAPALESYEKALAIGGPLPYAFSGYAECAANICDWNRTAQIATDMQSHVEGKSVVSPFILLGYDSTPAMQLACARRYAANRVPTLPAPMHRATGRSHDKLRVAYLSANFNRHAMAHLMVNLFERHNRSLFEITGISFGPDDGSDIRTRMAAAFDRFHDVRDVSDRDVARLLADHEIDIAVDIMGYTQDARPDILSHRPAPIQVNYLGYPGTMGTDFIDYIFADSIVVPPGEEGCYAEQVVRLPDCYQVNDSQRPIAENTPTRQQAGLPEKGFVFCSFNNNYKITAPVFDVWMRLLTAVEGSVLWLLRDNDTAEENLRRHAAARGVDPARLVFAGRLELPEHLARHRLADLFLDTLPYNAHTTCSDALWAGLPVLTCRGDSFPGRVAASLLHAVGLPELVTSSLADYAARALWFAQDPTLLGEIRKRLAENRLTSPLFDTDLSRQHIEIAYTAMWRLFQQGESPKGFKVEPSHDDESPRAAGVATC
jgi:protein O-GlcNAc transferase